MSVFERRYFVFVFGLSVLAFGGPLGNVTAYAYDARDRLTGITYADGTGESFAYDLFGNVATHVDALGTEFTNEHDRLNRLTQRTSEAGAGVFPETAPEVYTYDGLSRLATAADEDSAIAYTYDSLGNVLSEAQTVDETQRTVAFEYNNRGNRVQTAYPGGREIDYTYDALDRLSAIEEDAAAVADYTYAGGRVARLEYGNGAQKDITYNGIVGVDNAENDLGVMRPVSVEHKMGMSTVLDHRTAAWDAVGNRIRRQDARTGGPEKVVDFYYDPLSRLTQSDPTPGVAGGDTDYELDAAGNRTELDVDGSVETSTLSEGPDAGMNQYLRTESYTQVAYDVQGNLAVLGTRDYILRYDVHNRLVQYIESGERTTDEFDINNDYETFTELADAWSAANGYLEETADETGRILRPLDDGVEDLSELEVFTFSYRTSHDPADENTFDPEYYALAFPRVAKPATEGGAWDFLALVIEPNGLYLREWTGDALVELDSAPGMVTEQNAWYDVEVHFTGAQRDDLTISWGRRGNPLMTVMEATTTIAEPTDNRVGFGVGEGTDFQFDDLEFGSSSMTTGDVLKASFKYDVFGRRILATDSQGNTIHYFYDGDRVIEEFDPDTETVDKSFIYGNYVDEVLQMVHDTDNDGEFDNTFYYHTDDNFNVFALTDESGDVMERYDYNDYGKPLDGTTGTELTVSTVENPYLFTGRRWEADLGLYYNRARYLDPDSGRFLTRDPIGVWGDGAALGNAYTYGGNNPWTMADPYGMQLISDIDALTVPKSNRDPAGVRLPQVQGAFITTDMYTRKAGVLTGEAVADEIIFSPLMLLSGGLVNAGTRKATEEAAEGVTGKTLRWMRGLFTGGAKKSSGKMPTATSGLDIVLRPNMSCEVVVDRRGFQVPIFGQTGSSSTTPGHAETMLSKARELAETGEYEYITMQRSWRTATGRVGTSSLEPDIIAVRRNGIVDAYEILSTTDTEQNLRRRLTEGISTLPRERRRWAVSKKVMRIPDLLVLPEHVL